MASWSMVDAANKTRRAARAFKPWISLAKAHARAAVSVGRLAPGSLGWSETSTAGDPAFLIAQAELHGPVFKAWLDGKVTTCIFGLERGRRFLAENEHRIRAATTDLSPLFPYGSLRQMTGDPHLEYRRAFIAAFKDTPLQDHTQAIDRILGRLLQTFARTEQPVGFEQIRTLAKLSLTEILFRLVFGVERGWHGFEELMACYDRFAPNGMFIVVRPHHRAEYARMHALIASAAEAKEAGTAPSLLSSLVAARKLDETAIGNLIQMVEAGRFDMMGLWAWLLVLLASHGATLDRISDEQDDDARAALCRAVVLEALRLEQSEFIFRTATADIRFDGYFIPKRSRIRIAVWESHKDPEIFSDPFRFDPKRFIDSAPSSEHYAPFGLDQHRCLGADWVVLLSAMFVERLAGGMRWTMHGRAAPERGVFHFEPSSSLAVRFHATAVVT